MRRRPDLRKGINSFLARLPIQQRHFLENLPIVSEKFSTILTRYEIELVTRDKPPPEGIFFPGDQPVHRYSQFGSELSHLNCRELSGSRQ